MKISTLNGLQRYIEHRIPTGSFLEAVLSNDLKEACARADNENKGDLWEIVAWLYNNAPMSCWGSKQKYVDWLSEAKTIAE